MVERRSHVVHLRYRTRDIFEVVFELTDSGERFVVIASHWPSRRIGRRESEPLRIAVAENLAYLVRDHLLVDSITYEQLRADGRPGSRAGQVGDAGPADGRLQRRAVRQLGRRPPAGLERARPRDRTDQRHRRLQGPDRRLPRDRRLPLQPVLALPGAREPRHASSSARRRSARRSPTATRSWTSWSSRAGCSSRPACGSTSTASTSSAPRAWRRRAAAPARSTAAR